MHQFHVMGGIFITINHPLKIFCVDNFRRVSPNEINLYGYACVSWS